MSNNNPLLPDDDSNNNNPLLPNNNNNPQQPMPQTLQDATPTNDPNAVQGYQNQQAMQQQALQQQQAQQQALAQQQGINPTPTGTQVAGQVATASMPSIGAQQGQQPNGVPQSLINQWNNPNGGQGAIDPAQQSGIFQGAYAKGQIDAATMKEGLDANARANETQAWTRQAVTKDQQIQAGMQQAGLQGGTGAVMQYLQTADPDRANKFQGDLLGLQNSMLNNDKLQMLNDQQKQNAVFHGYSLLGNMGMAILQAPPEERDNMYQAMLPMVKAVNPDAPDTFNGDAQNMLMMGAVQGMPQSAVYARQLNQYNYLSDAGKQEHDLNLLYGQGKDDSDPAVMAIKSQLGATNDQAVQASLGVTNAQLSAQNKQAQLVTSGLDQKKLELGNYMTITNNYNSNPIIKDATTFDTQFSGIQGTINTLIANPNNVVAQASLRSQLSSLVSQGKGIRGLYASYGDLNGDVAGKLEELQNWVSSGKTQFPPKFIGMTNNLLTNLHNDMMQQVAPINAQFSPLADKYLPKDAQGRSGSKQINFLNTAQTQVPTYAQVMSPQSSQALLQKGYTAQQVQNIQQGLVNKWGLMPVGTGVGIQ